MTRRDGSDYYSIAERLQAEQIEQIQAAVQAAQAAADQRWPRVELSTPNRPLPDTAGE